MRTAKKNGLLKSLSVVLVLVLAAALLLTGCSDKVAQEAAQLADSKAAAAQSAADAAKEAAKEAANAADASPQDACTTGVRNTAPMEARTTLWL